MIKKVLYIDKECPDNRMGCLVHHGARLATADDDPEDCYELFEDENMEDIDLNIDDPIGYKLSEQPR